jgi:hypothetical protein
MGEPNQETYRVSATLDRVQGGAPFLPSDRLRHAQLDSWWERLLAVLGLVFMAVTLANILISNL